MIMSEKEAKIEGVGRLPILDPDDMLKIVQDKFPKIPGWFVQFADVVTTLLDVNQYLLIGHQEPQPCQLKVLGHGKICGRDADFILVNVVLERDTMDNVYPSNSRVRYYCSPCLYSTMCRAINSISKADKLEDVLDEGIVDVCQKILEQRAEFVEDAITRSADVAGEKYGNQADVLIEDARKKFEGVND